MFAQQGTKTRTQKKSYIFPRGRTNTIFYDTPLQYVEKSLEQADIEQDFEKNKRRIKVHVNLPRFKIESEHELNDVLKSMGMTDMYEPGKADFTGMIDGKIFVSEVKLFIIDPTQSLNKSQVIQKAIIEVDEEGPIATPGALQFTNMYHRVWIRKLPPVEFNANHPFLFFLRDLQSGMLLVQGRVADPTTA